MGKIKHTVSGFLKDAKYSFHFFGFLEKYEDKFENAELVEVALSEEIPYGLVVSFKKNQIIISEDGKRVIIKFTSSRYYKSNGKEIRKPTQEEVFKSLGHLMENAVIEYANKFMK